MGNVSSIHFCGRTYDGPVEGEYGVFTKSDGAVFAGSFANGCARFGVDTETDGTTGFVECDADGNVHGRVLACAAAGDTYYSLCEHGNVKEEAILRADGTCTYNGKACRADFAPFVALQAMVVPIKARPAPVPPQPPFFMPHSLAPTAP